MSNPKAKITGTRINTCVDTDGYYQTASLEFEAGDTKAYVETVGSCIRIQVQPRAQIGCMMQISSEGITIGRVTYTPQQLQDIITSTAKW